MRLKISFRKHWEENISLLIIILGFIELQTEAIHDVLKWPMIGLGIVALMGCYLFHRVDKRISIVIFGGIFLSVIELVFSEGILATQYIWDIGICIPAALCIYYAKHVSLWKWIFLYIAVTIYLVLRLITSPDHYSIFYSHSRNYISVFEIFLLFTYAIISYKARAKLPKWMYYSTVITCVIAIGRGGILAGLLLYVFYILYGIWREKQKGNKQAKLILLLIGVVLGFLIFIMFQDDIIQKFFPRFAKSGEAADSSVIAVNKRLLMWKSYVQSCLHSLKQFFLGTDPHPIVLKIHYRNDFNLHNSYMMTHVFYGIFGLAFLIVCFFSFSKRMLRENGEEVFIIFLSFIVRAFTDHCFPGKLSAIVIWVAIFYGVTACRKSKRRMKNQNYEHHT